MQTGDIFKIDNQAVQEMAKFYKRPEGDFSNLEGLEYSIAKSKVSKAVTTTEVRATKWEDGKPKRGRPRKFPRVSVARLLGETDDASLTGAVETEVVEETVEEVVDNTAKLEAEAKKVLAAETPTEDSW